ncbi:MAG: Ribose-phosphate pyrophosphokinase [Candidatus Fermentimicrarchaeum limneticum]|uniref:ribose-phosphate diphosphokinase n=1 Tax=Fermentimicrarchaeum limneticum TaxID=2795018 RepID=A0A7D6BAS5_FERL1|nr:MAG: Ribose-phosphate pyrophosphokinase [Candidatus Fermentimicrarchaeum limneticum]
MEKHLLVSPNCADLCAPNFEIKKFPDCENYVYIPDIDKLEGKDVVLLHRCYPDQDSRLFQLFHILEVVRPLAARVTALVPYLPYARKDEKVRKGEVKSASLICGMLANAGLNELVTFDCHFMQEGEGKKNYVGLNIDNRSLAPELLAYVKPKVSNPVFISPDIGTAYMVKKVGGVSMEKTLGDYVHGPVTFRQIIEEKLDFDVTGRDVILIDDMIIAGETMIRAAQVCKKGGAKRIICAAVHGLLVSCAFDKIRAAGAKEIVVSDSILGPAAVVSVKRRLTDYLP